MNKSIKKSILDKIIQYNRIIISCHIRPDGDCVGASKGLKDILVNSFPDKEIYLVNPQKSDFLAFLGEDTDSVPAELYADALAIQVDTSDLDHASNKLITTAKELIKIDHHIDTRPYGDISWVEEERSSCCEMIVDFLVTFPKVLKISKMGATYLYTGMVTDSGRFRYSSTGPETMRLAAYLLEQGIDTEWMYNNLYVEDMRSLRFKAEVFKNLKFTDNGVVYIYVTKKMRKKLKLTEEEAANAVSLLSAIKGCLVWIAFIDYDNNDIRVRLRSKFMSINQLAEQYNGGGHANACGASVDNKKQIAQLVAKADAMVAEYKAHNDNWL